LRLLVFGFGYSADFVVRKLAAQGWTAAATVRQPAKAEDLERRGIAAHVFPQQEAASRLQQDILVSDAVLVSIPPMQIGDLVLSSVASALAASRTIKWIGYLSTVGVYGDRNGAWVDEQTPIAPSEARSALRADVERAWLSFGNVTRIPVHVFRLSGIYGPGRNQLVQVRQGKARQVIKAGQVFNRVHVEDIANAITASIARPSPGTVYNVTDDEPAPPQDVICYAAKLCSLPAPPEVSFEDANLSPMARSFFSECKRVSNARLRRDLRVDLSYPNYRDGLTALRAAGDGL
jgi:nucleoside-diphosphate-sugar epimerase